MAVRRNKLPRGLNKHQRKMLEQDPNRPAGATAKPPAARKRRRKPTSTPAPSREPSPVFVWPKPVK